MPITSDFKPVRLMDKLEETGLRGCNLNFLTDLSQEQLLALFEAAKMIEPYSKDGLNLMNGKVLCTMFFQPSTRTRFSTETAMIRLGGSCISESNPAANSSAAKDESLSDTLRVVSNYADIIGLRHFNDTTIFDDIQSATVPVISCGYGNITHPTQGLLDMYTAWRALGHLDGIRVLVTSPDLTRARSGQSFAMGLARMGAEIVYSGPSELRTPESILEKLRATGCKFTEYFDCTEQEQEELVMQSDLVYLPGCSVPKGQDARDVFMKKARNYYIKLETLEKAKEKYGRTVGIMHSLPRFAGEFDFAMDVFRIVVKGKGGHGARPQECVDPITAAVYIHLALQELISRENAPDSTVSITVGSFRGGSAPNAIPDTVEMQGTMRTDKEETRQRLRQRIKTLVEAVGAAYRTEAELSFPVQTAACCNDAAFLNEIEPAICSVTGRENCDLHAPSSMLSDDFSEILSRVPGAYLFLGFGDEHDGCCYIGHNPKMRLLDEGMVRGSELLATVATSWLQSHRA